MRQLLRDRPALAGVLVLALFALSAYVAAYSFFQLKAATDARFTSGQRLQALGRALSAIQDAETSQRGFLLTGSDDYLQPYYGAVRRMDQVLQSLHLQFAGDPAASQSIVSVEALSRAKLTELERTIALRREAGFEPARGVVASNEGKTLMDQLRAAIGTLERREESTLAARIDAAQTRARFGITVLLFASVLTLPAIGSAVYLVARERRARDRVAELEAAARMQAAQLDEERLRAQESFIVALNEVAYRHDVRTHRIEWRGALHEVLGYDASSMGTDLDSWQGRVHPDDRDRVLADFERMRHERRPFDLEYRFAHADRSWRHVLDRGVPHFDGSGALQEVIGIMRDVTARRNAEAQLARLYERVQDILASVHDGFVELDREWTFVYVNDAATRLLGVPREVLEGGNMWTLFAPSIATPFHAASQRVMHGRQPERLDNFYSVTQRWYRNHFYPTREGMAILFEDVTAEKAMEADLEAERERYRTAFEQAPVGVMQVEFDGTIRRANRAMGRMLGYESDGLLGLNIRDITDPEFIAADERAWDAMRAGELSHRHVEKRYRRKDGSMFWGELTASALRNAAGMPLYFISIVQDVSARRAAAELLAQSHERARVFARELNSAIERERMRIAREIHDELGQAFTGLKMDVGWLRRRLAQHNGDASPMVTQRLESMSRFIDETLDSARRIATELRPALLDSLGLSAAIDAQVRQSAVRSGVETLIDLEADVRPAPDQATTLFRIAQEALTNIARHASATRIRVRLAEEDDVAVLEIEDDGRGFDAGDRRSNRLGLLGIRERAQLAGGSAEIFSAPGVGTRVTVRVPLTAPPATVLAEPA